MDQFLLAPLQTLFFANDTKQLITHLSHFLVISAVVIVILTALGFSVAETYGRYEKWKMLKIPAGICWFVQESPSFLVPLAILLFNGDCPTKTVNVVVIGMFMIHYFHRSFVYPAIRKGKPMPLDVVVSALVFCLLNGVLQGYGVICYTSFPSNYFLDVRFILGTLMFSSGVFINVWSDYRLANLRKPGETAYKIPTGGLFEFVSCANYFGEITEWWGYALAANCYPATSFAIFTTLFLSSRASSHHKFYQAKFKNYPTSRKAVIPFVF